MVSIKKLVLGTVAMIGLAGTANAAFVPATWSDEVGGTHYVAAGGSYTYSHDLTDNGFSFTPLSDVITNFSLSLDIYDDKSDKWYEGLELASVDITGLTQGFVSTFQFGNDAFTSGVTLLGLIELNLAGTLTVTVNSLLGDFNVGTSTLTARGYTAQVPEPGTIALLGLGLLGVGLGRRKKLAQ